MKKLFVLFLLISLVPFTVGCNLFGGDDDDSAPVTISKLSATATLPASAGKPSIRGAAVAATKFASTTVQIGNVVLNAVTEETLDNGVTYVVNYEKIVSAAEYQAATTGVVPVIITKHDGTTTTFAVDSAALASKLSISVNPTTGAVTTSAGTVYTNFAKVTSITESKNTLTPEFTVVFDSDIGSVQNPTAFDVKVTSGTTTVAASKDDFNVSYTSDTKTMKASLKNKELTDGKTYTVTINKLVNSNGLAIISTSHTFTVKLTQ